jgi:aquaporin Z
VGGAALTQLWLFLVVPTVAGLVAGWLSKQKMFD